METLKNNTFRRRLNKLEDPDFRLAWALYLESFPTEERRTKEDQGRVLLDDSYHFDVIYTNQEVIGFILWWKFEQLRYVEHLALDREQRSHGYGSQILEQFKEESSLPIILEVEKPETLVQQKRIKLYERLGFHLNTNEYFQPPYSQHQPPLSLLLMTWPQKLSSHLHNYFIHYCHSSIFP